MRTHLNTQIQFQDPEVEYDNDAINDADDGHQPTTGMMGVATLNAEEEDGDGDEELDVDVEGA